MGNTPNHFIEEHDGYVLCAKWKRSNWHGCIAKRHGTLVLSQSHIPCSTVYYCDGFCLEMGNVKDSLIFSIHDTNDIHVGPDDIIYENRWVHGFPPRIWTQETVMIYLRLLANKDKSLADN